MTNIVALIPAKGTSQRIPGKNLKELDGIPLVAWTIATALACESIDKVYVSSESEDVLSVARKFGAELLYRPEKLAGPLVPDLPVVEHFLKVVGEKVDLIVYLRPTTPLRSTGMVERGIQALTEAGTAASGLRSVHRMGESAYKCFEIRPGPFLAPVRWQGEDLTDKPDQLVIPTFKPNGYVDVILPATVAGLSVRTEDAAAWGGGSCFGDSVIPLVTPRVIELDDPEDWDHLACSLLTGGREVHEFSRGPMGR